MKRNIFANLLILILAHVAMPSASAQSSGRPFSVEDSVQMNRLVDPNIGVARILGTHFKIAPDGRHVALVSKKGSLDTGLIRYRLSVINLDEARAYVNDDSGDLERPGHVATELDTGLNRPAIDKLRWLDNETLAFIGTTENGGAAIYSIRIGRSRLRTELEWPRRIIDFDMRRQGGTVIFLGIEDKPAQSRREVQYGHVYTGPDLAEADDIFRQKRYYRKGRWSKVKALDIPAAAIIYPAISISPDEDHVVVVRRLPQVPMHWLDFEWGPIAPLIKAGHESGQAPVWLQRYELVNLKNGEINPLIDAPADFRSRLYWSSEDTVESTKLHLPLSYSDSFPKAAGRQSHLAINISSGNASIVAGNRSEPAEDRSKLTLSIQQDMNTPPDVLAKDLETGQSRIITELNPQLSGIELGNVELFSWQAEDQTWEGGLFYPPGFERGLRYPLVIQTHGFHPEEFQVDGPMGMSAAMAARALAAEGFLVLQAADRPKGQRPPPTLEAEWLATSFVEAVEELDRQGLIDTKLVGISGFSRSGFYVQRALTLSGFKFAAAVVADASTFDWSSYTQYFGHGSFHLDYETMLGGIPVGLGLKNWLEKNPVFHVENLTTPLRIESHLHNSWQDTFVLLKRLNRPVEMIKLPEAPHNPDRPWERHASQQGAVDWFRFWLLGEEDSDNHKIDQYKRWRQLRSVQQASSN